MLEKHASINLINKKGQTAVIIAAEKNVLKCLRILLTQTYEKVKLDAKTDKGFTALIFASKNGNVECLSLLLEHLDCHLDDTTDDDETGTDFL